MGADGNALPEDVIKGKTFSNSSSKGLTGTLELKPEPSGTATSADVLSGKTFSSDTEIRAPGAMVNNGSITITPSTYATTIPKGYHTGLGKVIGDNDLRSENIRSGMAIFGVLGDSNVVDTSYGDATSDDILGGKQAWVGGQLITGGMSENGGWMYTPTTTDQTIPEGYHPGTGFVQGDPNLKPENIAKGVTIFGVVGTASFTFTDNGDGTVTNNASRLMWQQGELTDRLDWDNSNAYCDDLDLAGHTDWRLPTKDELKSLIFCSNNHPVPTPDGVTCTNDGSDTDYDSPTIDTSFFPTCINDRYWTSTMSGVPDRPYWVDFRWGVATFGYMPWPVVKCVR